MENASFDRNEGSFDEGLTQGDLIYKIGEQQAHLMQKDKAIKSLQNVIQEIEDARPELKKMKEKVEELSKSNQNYKGKNEELADKLSELRGVKKELDDAEQKIMELQNSNQDYKKRNEELAEKIASLRGDVERLRNQNSDNGDING